MPSPPRCASRERYAADCPRRRTRQVPEPPPSRRPWRRTRPDSPARPRGGRGPGPTHRPRTATGPGPARSPVLALVLTLQVAQAPRPLRDLPRPRVLVLGRPRLLPRGAFGDQPQYPPVTEIGQQHAAFRSQCAQRLQVRATHTDRVEQAPRAF